MERSIVLAADVVEQRLPAVHLVEIFQARPIDVDDGDAAFGRGHELPKGQ